jgi:hypothetical protein
VRLLECMLIGFSLMDDCVSQMPALLRARNQAPKILLQQITPRMLDSPELWWVLVETHYTARSDLVLHRSFCIE